MSGRFDGKVAIVTGGSSGIGAATSLRLTAEGARVVVADRHPPAEPDARIQFRQIDLTAAAAAADMVAAVAAECGRLDFLVNNAGIGAMAEAAEQTDEAWHKVIAINLHAVMYCTRAALPVMRRQGGGAIVNVASISGLAGDYAMGPYAASKSAVIGYTKSVAMDYARDGIRVNAVCPGLIRTPMTAPIPNIKLWKAGIPMGRAADPSEIASVIAFLLSQDASFMTGSIVVADGGLTAYTGQPRSSNLPPLAEVP